MKLRQKTLLLVGASLLVANIVLYATASTILLSGSEKLAKQHAFREAETAHTALAIELIGSEKLARSRANWLETVRMDPVSAGSAITETLQDAYPQGSRYGGAVGSGSDFPQKLAVCQLGTPQPPPPRRGLGGGFSLFPPSSEGVGGWVLAAGHSPRRASAVPPARTPK